MLSLSEWATVAEIVASIGVIVSLVFLAYSIREKHSHDSIDE